MLDADELVVGCEHIFCGLLVEREAVRAGEVVDDHRDIDAGSYVVVILLDSFAAELEVVRCDCAYRVEARFFCALSHLDRVLGGDSADVCDKGGFAFVGFSRVVEQRDPLLYGKENAFAGRTAYVEAVDAFFEVVSDKFVYRRFAYVAVLVERGQQCGQHALELVFVDHEYILRMGY